MTASPFAAAAARVAEEQAAEWLERTPASRALARRAERSLAAGVTSAWQAWSPGTVWLERGSGSRVWDVDGNEYLDLHGGFGATIAGHGHPAVTEAIRRQASRGTHFAQPSPDAVTVAEELARRFGLPRWRFTSSGTEATLDAVHLMRAATRRPLVIKVEGHYHGHHDALSFSVDPSASEMGPAGAPHVVPATGGLSAGAGHELRVVPFDDLDAVAGVLDAHRGQIAGMILEPIAMNPVPIAPRPGYLAGLRTLLTAHDALLAFDEVQTGLTVDPGGATALYGVVPDVVCVAKALGGGFPVAAVGGTREVMRLIETGAYKQVGTLNGNPLAMAVVRAILEQVLTPAGHAAIASISSALAAGARTHLAAAPVPGTARSLGAKGCVLFDDVWPTDHRSVLGLAFPVARGHWLYQLNHGVLTAPSGKWLATAAHGPEDVALYLRNLRGYLAAIAGRDAPSSSATASRNAVSASSKSSGVSR